MNFILPVFLFSLSYMIPQEASIGRAVITEVAPDSPAAKAGLQPGDVVLKINNRTINNVADLSYNVRLNLGSQMTMRVQRTDPATHQSEIKDLRVRARWAPPDGQGPTGIAIGSQYPFTESVSYPPWEAFPKGVQATLDSLVFLRNEVIAWTKGGPSAIKVSGPIGIAQATGEVVKQAGWKPLLEFAALLSINLGILNILPLPMLDGGRVVFVLLEILRRGKRIAPEKEALVHFIGFAAIITLVVVISYFDVLRIIRGESLFR